MFRSFVSNILIEKKSENTNRYNYLSLGQPKVNKVKFFLPCLEVMKRPQTKFQVDAMRGFKVIKSRKSQNSGLGQKKSLAHFLFDINYLSVTTHE